MIRMVEFKQKLDRNNKIYIPKLLREAGFKGTIRIRPDDNVAIIYPESADLSSVKISVELLLREIDHFLKGKPATYRQLRGDVERPPQQTARGFFGETRS